MLPGGLYDTIQLPARLHKRNRNPVTPKVSIILLDWSCREQVQALRWLGQQNVPRDSYEVIWVELHHRLLGEAMEHADAVVTLSQRGLYHKHKGYNAGLLLSRGEIICICDSDAVFPEDFILSILKAFYPGYGMPAVGERASQVPSSFVLMHHQKRTWLTYPEQLERASELKDEKKWPWWPMGYNVGACVSVRRVDAVRFGGFDEDKSYRGYLCGPYDLAWRLINAGVPEVWHDESTVLWHFAHPDPAGTSGIIPNFRRIFEIRYPHVDLHAITAVEHFSTGRLLPLTENRHIHKLRMLIRHIGSEFEKKYANITGPEGFSRAQISMMRWRLFFKLTTDPARRYFQQRGWKAIGVDPLRSLARLVKRTVVALLRAAIHPVRTMRSVVSTLFALVRSIIAIVLFLPRLPKLCVRQVSRAARTGARWALGPSVTRHVKKCLNRGQPPVPEPEVELETILLPLEALHAAHAGHHCPACQNAFAGMPGAPEQKHAA